MGKPLNSIKVVRKDGTRVEIGQKANASGSSAIAIGSSSTAADTSVAIGYSAKAEESAVALGEGAYATANSFGVPYAPDKVYFNSKTGDSGATKKSLQEYLDEKANTSGYSCLDVAVECQTEPDSSGNVRSVGLIDLTDKDFAACYVHNEYASEYETFIRIKLPLAEEIEEYKKYRVLPKKRFTVRVDGYLGWRFVQDSTIAIVDENPSGRGAYLEMYENDTDVKSVTFSGDLEYLFELEYLHSGGAGADVWLIRWSKMKGI